MILVRYRRGNGLGKQSQLDGMVADRLFEAVPTEPPSEDVRRHFAYRCPGPRPMLRATVDQLLEMLAGAGMFAYARIATPSAMRPYCTG